jgi:hypothetical protein
MPRFTGRLHGDTARVHSGGNYILAGQFIDNAEDFVTEVLINIHKLKDQSAIRGIHFFVNLEPLILESLTSINPRLLAEQ